MGHQYGKPQNLAGGRSGLSTYQITRSFEPIRTDPTHPYTEKLNNLLVRVKDPMEIYLPAVGRFLIVVTFFEDVFRILTQWSDQVLYLDEHRGIPTVIAHAFLIINAMTMGICSSLVLFRKHLNYAVIGLVSIIIIQALGYGLIFDFNFFLRNSSVIGGLVMILANSWRHKSETFAGIPRLGENNRKMYIQLVGRLLLVLLFIEFVIHASRSIWSVFACSIGAAAVVMVIIGFRAKFSATLLLGTLCIVNLLVNNFWTFDEDHPHKDFVQYNFFQNLSIVGGLLLLADGGPGQLSLDEKKKV